MIFNMIGILVCIVGLINYKKGFFLFLIYKIILVPNINVLSLPGIPMVTMEMFLSMYYFILFLINGRKYKAAKVGFPFTKPFILLMISWFMSSVFAIAGFVAEITRMITMSLSEILIIYIIWELVENERDFSRLFKWFTIVIFVTCIYGLFEYAIKANPIVTYETSLVIDASKVVNWNTYGDTIRGYRVQSFFNHAIGAGINWVLYFVWFFTAMVFFKWKIPNKLLAIATSVLCLPCILLTNSRAPIVFFLICCLNFVDFKKRRIPYFLLIVLLASGVAFSPIIANYSSTILSIFNSNAQGAVGGSTVSMRFEQLGVSLVILKRSPLFGMGTKFLDYMELGIVLALRGLESVWFIAITEYGILGIIAYLVRAIFEVIVVPRYFKSREARILALAYWVTYTMTSLPGFLTYMYYIMLFFYIKESKIYQEGIFKNYKSKFGSGIRLKGFFSL